MQTDLMTFALINKNTMKMVMVVPLIVFGSIVCGDHTFSPNGAQKENLKGRSVKRWSKSRNRSNLSQCQSHCQRMKISYTYDILSTNI